MQGRDSKELRKLFDSAIWNMRKLRDRAFPEGYSCEDGGQPLDLLLRPATLREWGLLCLTKWIQRVYSRLQHKRNWKTVTDHCIEGLENVANAYCAGDTAEFKCVNETYSTGVRRV